MNTKIGTSFGLALLMAFGVVATMLVMGLFAPKAEAAAPVVGTPTASPGNPGSTATIKIPFTNSEQVLGNSGEIWVAFDKLYGVPDSIDKESVSISTGQTTGGVSNPLLDPTVDEQEVAFDAYVGVSDTIVKLAIGDTVPNSTTTIENIEANTGKTHTITFSSSAGITVPTGSSTSANQIRISTDSGANWSTVKDIDTARELNLSATSGARGKVVTVTGKGFSGTGDATVWLDGSSGTGTVGTIDSGEFIIESGIAVSGGTFEVEFTLSLIHI